MTLVLKSKDGIWYWSDGNLLDVSFPAALHGKIDGVFLPTDPTSPPAAEVVCPRSITFTVPGSPGATVTVVEDGGNLDFTVNMLGPKADLSGLFFDLTNNKLSGLTVSGDPQITQFVTGAGSVINLKNGVNLNGAKVPAFDVGMEFGLAGIGSDHLNIQSASFVLSDSAHDLSIDDLHPAGETGIVGIRTLSVGQKLEAVAPYAPTATPDTVTTLEDTSITIPVSALATDRNGGAILRISEIGSGAEGPQYGTVTIAPDGQSIIYTPTTLDYMVDGILTGNQDAFQVCVTDSFGGEVTSFVTVNATPVADPPKVTDQIAAPHAGDAATTVRFDVTVTSGDFATIDQMSDYIKSLALSLTGTNTSGITVTDTAGLLSGNLINAPANPGQFTDELVVSLPSGSTFSDTLSMTGTNAETENTGVPPTASTTISQTITADTETTLEDTPITIPIGNLVSGANMKITQVAPGPLGPKYGTISIAPDGQSLIYTPTTLDDIVNGMPTGDQDVFQVYSSDGAGNNAVTLLTVKETPVADTPSVDVKVLPMQPGDPINEVRLQVTSRSGDFGTVNQGSDFIQSIALNLTGTTSASSITDTLGLLSGNTITLNSSNQGSFQDEIDVLMPTDTSVVDSLGITATAAETENTAVTASNSTSQSIAIDNVKTSNDLNFQTSGQSIWDTGAAFSKDFNTGFLGIDKSYSTSKKAVIGTLGISTTIASAGANLHFRAGVQADLKITAGDISATLPFQVGLDSTYNKTTDTLQIMATDMELGNGHFTAHGPSGSFTFGLDLGLSAGAHATVFGTGPSVNVTVGSFTKPVLGFSLKSSQLSTTIDLKGGSLTLAFPNVNTNGSNPNPGTISGTGTSNDIVNLSGDLVAIASNILLGSDVTDINVGPLSIDVLDLILGIGLNVVQKFDLNSSGLVPALVLEDGTVESLSFGTPLTIPNASTHDLNHDGKIDLNLGLVPAATLTNNTSLGATMNASITALALSVSHIGSFTAFKAGTTVQLGTFPPIYNKTFALNGFGQQTVTQTV
ncbi:Ig-like domain-containing protein [Bradyrhizobium acaciae]|uniref:Ig-like domain-containing protein n=1 Tax=Bradyrhizobium acaciae TaxID=2683706 RepID=UPI001E55F842|nr:hypothetical protein [Bradyrhizobium acaciae]MCC8977397.1 hypothetical protein [Bradyrhizobium acaciae]